MRVILGSLAPVTLLLACNAPPPDSPQARGSHAAYLVSHTLLIGCAGIAANLHLHRLLKARAIPPAAATTTLLAWLGGNGFLGAQFSWILRPFFGSPKLEVSFLRPHPLEGNFYETVWMSLVRIAGGFAAPLLVVILIGLCLPVVLAIRSHPPQPPNQP